MTDLLSEIKEETEQSISRNTVIWEFIKFIFKKLFRRK